MLSAYEVLSAIVAAAVQYATSPEVGSVARTVNNGSADNNRVAALRRRSQMHRSVFNTGIFARCQHQYRFRPLVGSLENHKLIHRVKPTARMNTSK